MATKLKTTEQFIVEAKNKYGAKYDYSKVNYINSRTKITIICPKHGEYQIKPLDHLRKKCYKCAHNIYTTNEWIVKAKELHANNFDYSNVEYVNYNTLVNIRCIKHDNKFQIIPYNHFKQKSGGCDKCKYKAREETNIPKQHNRIRNRYTTESFIEASIKIHGKKYDYSKVNYTVGMNKVIIMCHEHGEFQQQARKHLQGQGCIKCVNKYNYSNVEFVIEANKIHENKYDYSKTVYKKGTDKIIIICKEHGEFKQIASSHLTGRGCPKCSGKYIPTTKEWIEKALEVHNNKYDYSKTIYNKNKDKIIITCKIHGDFEQQPSEHLRGYGCLECSGKKKYTTDEFIKLAKQILTDDYNYSKTKYINNKTELIIICKKHGDFKKTPNKVISRKEGCPSCAFRCYSKGQIEWMELLKFRNPNIQYILNNGEHKIKNSKYYADGYCNDTNTIFEYHGDYFHGNLKIYKKDDINQKCNKTFGDLYERTQKKKKHILKNGYNYVEIWESEWMRGIYALKIIQKRYRNYFLTK